MTGISDRPRRRAVVPVRQWREPATPTSSRSPTSPSPDNLTSGARRRLSAPTTVGRRSQFGNADTAGLGTIDSSSLEASTVDLATELTNMVEAQSSYEANSKVFQTGAEHPRHPQQSAKPDPSRNLVRGSAMTLSSAFNIINSAFASTAAQSAVDREQHRQRRTRRICRAKSPIRSTTPYGGSEVVSVTRRGQQRPAGPTQRLDLGIGERRARSPRGWRPWRRPSTTARRATTSTARTQNGDSPSAMLANLQSALATYAATPSEHGGRAGGADGRAAISTSLAERRRAAVQQVRAAGRRRHGHVGRRRSIRCSTSSPRSTRSIVAGTCRGRRRHARPRTPRNSILTQLRSRSASRRRPIPTARCRSTPTAA